MKKKPPRSINCCRWRVLIKVRSFILELHHYINLWTSSPFFKTAISGQCLHGKFGLENDRFTSKLFRKSSEIPFFASGPKRHSKTMYPMKKIVFFFVSIRLNNQILCFNIFYLFLMRNSLFRYNFFFSLSFEF